MHALFQRANFDHFMMRDPARDYKDVVFLPTFIVAALVMLFVRSSNTLGNFIVWFGLATSMLWVGDRGVACVHLFVDRTYGSYGE